MLQCRIYQCPISLNNINTQPTKCFDFTTNRRVLSILYDACSSSCGCVWIYVYIVQCVCGANNVCAGVKWTKKNTHTLKYPETQRYMLNRAEDVCSSLLNRNEWEIHVQIKLKKSEKIEQRIQPSAERVREEDFGEFHQQCPNLLHSCYYFHLNTVHIFHWIFPFSVGPLRANIVYVRNQTHLIPTTITITTSIADAYM